MRASQSFFDVLVGKLTAYVDASCRPAPTIQAPSWVPLLNPLPFAAAGGAFRAYASQGAPDSAPTGVPWYEAIARHRAGNAGTADGRQARRPVAASSRTPTELMGISLLQRLGATGISNASTDGEIRSAYRRLLRACHPDAHPDARAADRVVLNARLRAVIRAWHVYERRADHSVPTAA